MHGSEGNYFLHSPIYFVLCTSHIIFGLKYMKQLGASIKKHLDKNYHRFKKKKIQFYWMFPNLCWERCSLAGIMYVSNRIVFKEYLWRKKRTGVIK